MLQTQAHAFSRKAGLRLDANGRAPAHAMTAQRQCSSTSSGAALLRHRHRRRCIDAAAAAAGGGVADSDAPPVRGVIFDVDGVLCSSEHLSRE